MLFDTEPFLMLWRREESVTLPLVESRSSRKQLINTPTELSRLISATKQRKQKEIGFVMKAKQC
jgi:hypothetical protein